MEPTPLKTFIIYARADAQFKDELLKHLHPFVRNGLLERWVDSDLLPGEEWEKRIEKELDAAHLVIMLVSADALYSDFIEKKELKIALEKKQAGAARVVPILVRDCLWEDSSLSTLQLLPKDENGRIRGVAAWTSHDSAWTHCLRELKKLVDEIRAILQKETEAAEAAKIAEEWKKQQSVEAEKIERSRHRLDEAFWKKTSERILATLEAQEKIDLLEDYLQDAEHHNYRIEAEERLEEYRAELTAIRKVKEAQERREAKRRQQEEEAARLAEQARLEEIEGEKRQKAESEKQKQKYERLQKQDEMAWKAALGAIEKAKTAQEKMDALEVYLDELEYKIHRAEAEDQLEKLKAAETARKIKEKQREQQRLEAVRKKRAAERAEQGRKEQEDAHLVELKKLKEAEKGLPEMVLVRGGTFQMGSNEDNREKPIHSVTLPGFEIGKYPVTQKFWQEIMGSNPSHFKGCDDCPVEQVSWNDVQEFLKKLNQKYPGKNYRLPSEAEWEYAARGGKQSKGYTYAGSNDIEEVAWYDKNSGGKTHPVGSKKANELGIYDLSGNVREWCQDVWLSNYQGASKNDRARYHVRLGRNSRPRPVGVVRGGSWNTNPSNSRVTYRIKSNYSEVSNFIGIRLVRH